MIAALVDDLAFAGERREAALGTLATLGAAARTELFAHLTSGEREARANAARALQTLAQDPANAWSDEEKDKGADALVAALPANDDDVRAVLIEALGALGRQSAVPVLIGYLADENFLCVCTALALGRIGDSRAVEPLVAVLADPQKYWVPRGAAAVALGDLGAAAHSALPALRAAANSPGNSGEHWDERAAEAVADANQRIEHAGTPSALIGKGARYEMWGRY